MSFFWESDTDSDPDWEPCYDMRYTYAPWHADCWCKPGNLVLAFTIENDEERGDYGMFYVYENEVDITGIRDRAFDSPPRNRGKGDQYSDMYIDDKCRVMPIFEINEDKTRKRLRNEGN